tara:strand:- start:2060 stop:2890 length:831 start_codon:yes stop_codon:yes gene_type:complete
MEYLVLSALFFAFSNVLWKWIISDYFPLQVIVKRSILTCFIGIIVLIFNYNNLIFYNTIGQAFFVNLTCIIGAFGLVFMIYAIKQSSLNTFIHYSLVGSTVTATYLYLVEDIVPKNYALGISFIALGFFIFLWKQRNNIKVISFSTHRYLFAMALCFSANAIMQWYNLKTYDLVFLAVHQELVVLIVAGFMLYFLKQPLIPFFKLDYIPVMAFVVFIAIVLGMYGLKVTNPFFSSIISLTSSIFTMMLAVILLKEQLKWYYTASLLTVLYGAWLLS